MHESDAGMNTDTHSYALHHVVFPLRVTKDGVMVWCDNHEMSDNYTDGHMTFRRQYVVGDTMPVPLRASGTTLAEVAEQAVMLCEERGFRLHAYQPMLDHGIAAIISDKKRTLQHTGVAIAVVLDDGVDMQNSHGKWWLLSEVYDYIEYCRNDEKEQMLVYIRRAYPWRVRKRLWGIRHLLHRRWPL